MILTSLGPIFYRKGLFDDKTIESDGLYMRHHWFSVDVYIFTIEFTLVPIIGMLLTIVGLLSVFFRNEEEGEIEKKEGKRVPKYKIELNLNMK